MVQETVQKPVVDLKTVKDKLYDKLKMNNWAERLKTFVLSSEMDVILNNLLQENDQGHRFTPPVKTMLRAFEVTRWYGLKVVILNPGPIDLMTEEGVIADGLALSNSNLEGPDKVLKVVFDAISESVYRGSVSSEQMDPDLLRWADQGVLLLNTSLTTRIGEKESHKALWSDFIKFVLRQIADMQIGVHFILLGQRVKEYEHFIGKDHTIYDLEHPSKALFNGHKWNHQDVFNVINLNLVTKLKEKAIEW